MINKIKQALGMSGVGEETIGSICTFAGIFAPKYFLNCDGSLLQINDNAALFSVIGTMYGGDGIKTFGLPDLRPLANDGQPDTGHHRRVDWAQLNLPRQVICVQGIYPNRP